MEEIIKTSATNDDFATLRKEMREGFANFSDEFNLETEKTILYLKEWKISNLKWMFFFWIMQVAATYLTFYYFYKK